MMNGWMGERMNKWMDDGQQMNDGEWMDGQISGWNGGWMNGWMDKWMEWWMDV